MQKYIDVLQSLVRPIPSKDLPLSLEPMQTLLAAVGNPQNRFNSIVMAGSTGKGTAAARIAAEQRQTQAKVGLYISPHLHLFRERFSINDALISHETFIEAAQVVQEAAQRAHVDPSTFESATAIAFWWFAQQKVDIAVLEVGLGGRFDAVNIAPHTQAYITPIESEHSAMLGGSLESIAWHKAGIIPPRGEVISAPQHPSVMAVIEAEAAAQGAHLSIDAHLFQRTNSLLPARLEQIRIGEKDVIIDGGHTPLSAQNLYDLLKTHNAQHITLIIGMLRDKRIFDTLSVLSDPRIHLIATAPPADRALTADALAEIAAPLFAQITVIADADQALAKVHATDADLVVIFGSFRLAAAAREAYGLLTPHQLEEANATRALFEGEGYQRRMKQ